MSGYFCMGAYKCDVVIITKIGACIHGCLFCMGAYYPDLVVNVATCTCIAVVSHVKVYLSGECCVDTLPSDALRPINSKLYIGHRSRVCYMPFSSGWLLQLLVTFVLSTTDHTHQNCFCRDRTKEHQTKQSDMPQRVAYYHQRIPKLLNGVDPFIITSNYCLVGMHLLCTT